jgi:hypothetical protein
MLLSAGRVSCTDVEQQMLFADPANLCVKRRHKESWDDNIPSRYFVHYLTWALNWEDVTVCTVEVVEGLLPIMSTVEQLFIHHRADY